MAERPIVAPRDEDAPSPVGVPPAGPVLEADGLPHASREGLATRSARSVVTQMTAQGAKLVLLVTSGVILARLLTPTDFGLLAMVSVVTGFVESIRHFGLPQAAVHSDEISTRQASALFWRSVELSVVTSLAMAVSAPLLALFYGEPRVIGIMLVFSLAFAVRGLSAVHEAILMRDLRFGRLVGAELVALAVGLTVGLILAWTGAGYHALVLQVLVVAVVQTGALWWIVRWRPGWHERGVARQEARQLLTYGSELTRFQMLTYAGRNVDRLLVGFFEGARNLGFYDAAYRWSLYPVQQIYAPLTNVALSSLARVRHDRDAYRRACRIGLLPVFSVVFPALAFLALEPERTILVLLGDQWEPAVPLFRVLCIGAMGSIIIKITRWLYMAEGHTSRQLRWGLLFMPVMLVAVAAGVPWGPMGVALGYTAGTWLLVPSALATCVRGSALRARDLLAVMARPGAAALAGVLASRALAPPAADPGDPLVLLRQLCIFALATCAAWLILPGGRDRLRELVALMHAAAPHRRLPKA